MATEALSYRLPEAHEETQVERMELRHLRYFVAVGEELHFRPAAERLYVAQPAISEQIRKLEVELGVGLLNRTHHKVSLTEAGAALLAEARRVLQQVDIARLAAQEARNRATIRLRIGYTPYGQHERGRRALAGRSDRFRTDMIAGLCRRGG